MLRRIVAWLRRMKAWTEGAAQRPGAAWILFAIAFAESSFFPIPPDVLLIALAMLVPTKAFWNALVCSIGSVVGGLFGYLIGLEFFELIGQPIINFYGVQAQYDSVRVLFEDNAYVSIAVAGFTPIPYKVFTIAAGAFHIDFTTFTVASAVSRPARFFLVASLFYWFGPKIKPFIDKYFEWLTLAFMVLLVGGFVLIKYLL